MLSWYTSIENKIFPAEGIFSLVYSSIPNPVFKDNQGHIEQAAQDHVQTVSEGLQEGRLYNHSGQPVLLNRVKSLN